MLTTKIKVKMFIHQIRVKEEAIMRVNSTTKLLVTLGLNLCESSLSAILH